MRKSIKNYIGLLFFSLTFLSCGLSEKPPSNEPVVLKSVITGRLSAEEKEHIRKRCITNLDRFIQGQADDLYGKECLAGQKLIVKVNADGPPVASSASIDHSAGTDALRLEGQLDFINKIYKANYSVSPGEESDTNIPFLKDFLPPNKRFIISNLYPANESKKYTIIFQIEGNYLILYKASQDLDDIPYTERTALEKSKDGSYKKSDGYYKVPFVGYPIEYCSHRVNLIDGRDTNELEVGNCEKVDSEQAQYIRVRKGTQQLYRYVEEKQDLFPVKYFEGEWFFNEGRIEGPIPNSDIFLSDAYIVKFDPQTNYLNAIDISGNVKDEKNKRNRIDFIPIVWQKYEVDKEGDKIIAPFKERVSPKDSAITTWPYLRINAKQYIDNGQEIVDFLVSEDFFSLTLKRGNFKYKVSFLRKSAVDDSGFAPRRWFRDDHESHFGILKVEPQKVRNRGEISENERQALIRMVHFNINSQKTQKTIKWYFSKNSVEDNFYRNIAKEAVQIYDQAFQMITNGKVRVELIEDDEKDLGDFRYNTINLIKSEDFGGIGLLGVAPDYVNLDTGQVIGGTANIFLNSTLETSDFTLRHYIRYEIFQKDTKSEEENKAHVVSDHLKNLIQTRCPEIEIFITAEKEKNRKPADDLGDTELYKACSKKISREYILSIILHEMGHNFGLGHNFQASYDKSNSYKSVEEMKKYFPNATFYEDLDSVEVTKSSSVMDYLPLFNVPAMTVLGKYDLAALRFLYMGQIEMQDEKIVSLNIPEDPSQQKELNEDILSQRKAYHHCSDEIAYNTNDDVKDREQFICRRGDYGSSPLEIVNFLIEELHRGLNGVRYRYDAMIAKPSIMMMGVKILGKVEKFYQRWILLRNEYLNPEELSKSKYLISEEEDRIEDYTTLISSDKKEKEYEKYYNVRKPIYGFFLKVLSFETMKCEVSDDDKNTHAIDLELIKEHALEYMLPNPTFNRKNSMLKTVILRRYRISFQAKA